MSCIWRYGFLWLLLAPLYCLGQGTAGDPGGDILAEFADELGVSLEGTAFELVRWDAPDTSIASDLFYRQMPGWTAASTFPHIFRIGPTTIIEPRQKLRENGLGFRVVREPHGRVKIPDRNPVVLPGSLPLAGTGEDGKPAHPAVRTSTAGIRILCAPVRFDAMRPDGGPEPVRLIVSDGRIGLLEKEGPYNPLILWLPIGVEYTSTFGSFRLQEDGSVEPIRLEAGVELAGQGLRKILPAPEVTTPRPPGAQPHLWAHRGRSVFAETETARFYLLLPPALHGTATMIVDDREVGKLTVRQIEEARWNSVGFDLDMSAFAPGQHRLQAQIGELRCELGFEVVPWHRRSSFLVQSMSCCTGAWATREEGLALLHDAGLEMVTATAHRSNLDTRMPWLKLPDDASLPPELGWQRSANDETLERLLAHRLRLIDLTVARGDNFYNEGLSVQHSHPRTVDRMIRRMQIFTQQTAAYPSFWGVNYGWFPKLAGYWEGGVPIDPWIHERRRILSENATNRGGKQMSREDRAWYLEHRFSANGETRQRAWEMLQQHIAWWKAYDQIGFAEHHELYNAAVRQVRPETRTVLFDNAGHDADNRARSQFHDMSAICYESYTDYGEWPMSTAFTTEWARGSYPGKPVWLTVDWGTSTPGMARSLFHGISRGLQGGGAPMQEDVSPKELRQRGQFLRLAGQYGTVADVLEPDGQVAILATLGQRMLDGRAYYAYHAIYSHLTRLGYPARIIDEEDLHDTTRVDLLAGVKVLWLVRQEQPLDPRTVRHLQAFREGGGLIYATGDSSFEELDVPRVGGEVRDIWRLDGFFPTSHQRLWSEFLEAWREPLTVAMQEAGMAPLASTDPLRAFAVAADAGPVRYVWVFADEANAHARDVAVTPDLAVSLAGEGWQVRDLVHQQDLAAVAKDGRTEVTVELITEPLVMLALYRSPPARIQLERNGQTEWRATVMAADDGTMGALPLSWKAISPAGEVRGQSYRNAGESYSFSAPAGEPGEWKIQVQEQLTGLIAEASFTAAGEFAPMQAVPAVEVVDARHLHDYLQAPGEKVIIVEPEQRHYLPLARELLAGLQAKGIPSRLWEVQPEDYDTIPNRWYAWPEDEPAWQGLLDGKLIAWRDDLKPYIDSVKREHVAERGGYTTIAPHWMVHKHVILFSGGRLAESLRAVSAWLPTPSIPAPGAGRLLVAFSPFTARHHALVIGANDHAGMTVAAKHLIAQAGEQLAAAPMEVASSTWASVSDGTRREPVATPLAGFRPHVRLRKLLAVDDHLAVQLDGKQDTLAWLTPDGQVQRTLRLPAGEARLDNAARIWLSSREGEIVTQRAFTPEGRLQMHAVAIPDLSGFFLPPDGDRSGRSAVLSGHDGETLVWGRQGGFWYRVGDAWRFYDDAPHVRNRVGIWTPRFPIGMKLSPESGHLLFSMDSRPNGTTNMSGFSFWPRANETVLFDLSTGERVWSKSGRDGQYVVHRGFAAVADGGERVALADFAGWIRVLDRSGKELVAQHAQQVPLNERSYYTSGPEGGVGVWMDRAGKLALFGFKHRLIMVVGEQVREMQVADLVDAAVANDGSQVLAAQADGTLIAWNADGSERWRLEMPGLYPRVVPISAAGMVVADHSGMVRRLDTDGKTVWEIDAASAVDAGTHTPVVDGATTTAPASEYREPGTLEIAKRLLKAELVEAWQGDGEGRQAHGHDFRVVAQPIALTAPGSDGLLHLVYRYGEGADMTVTIHGKRTARRFLLDLPTPEYRVVALPLEAGDTRVELAPRGSVEIAKAEIWRMAWPGKNIAHIQEMTAGAAAVDMGSTRKGDDLLMLDDLETLGGDYQSYAGALKDVALFAWNRDPDKVKGVYLTPGIDPFRVFNNARFEERFPAWSSKDLIGPWITIEFPKAVPLSLVATYDRVMRQSEVSRFLAVFTDFDASEDRGFESRDSGTVLSSAIFNDQFWRLLPLGGKPIKQLGVHVRRDVHEHGLSEIEAYAAPVRK